MSAENIDRKIAVIFAADVVGYSKHVETDEDATLASLNACSKLIEPLIKEQKGRIFNTGGDSILAELPSAVAAVNMAVAIQNKIKDRNADAKTEVKLEYRIGINMGDVVKQGPKNLMGDGVNIAARLESLAQPGGITISKNIYDLVVNKTKYQFNDLGEQKVKDNKFHAYDLMLPSLIKRKLRTKSSTFPRLALIFGGITALLIGLFFSLGFEKEKKLDSSKIVILPFKSLSENKKEKLLAFGISQDLGSKLTKSSKMLNVLNLKKIPENLGDISKKTNASYLVDGTLMQLDNMLRVKVDLIDGKTISNIWSETYDRDLSGRNLFKLQDDIIKKVVNELVGAGAVLSKDINNKIISTGTADLSIYECINFSRGVYNKALNEKAIDCLQKSVMKDPNYADAWIWLADRKRAHYSSFSMTDKYKYMLAEASTEIDRGLALDPESAFGYTAKVQIEFFKKNWESMFNVAEKAYSMASNDPNILAKIGQSIAFGGQCEASDVQNREEKSIKVEPNRCQFHRGCWDLGLKARKLDIGNFSIWDNYLIAICSSANQDGKNIVSSLEPLQHKKFFWWEFNLGLAYHYLSKFKIAEAHFERAKVALKSKKISKVRSLYTKFNSHLTTFSKIDRILPNYGFE